MLKKPALVLSLLLVAMMTLPCQAQSASEQEENKAVARAALFDYLNHKDFKRFEEVHTKDFVKHYNNPAENLSEENAGR